MHDWSGVWFRRCLSFMVITSIVLHIIYEILRRKYCRSRKPMSIRNSLQTTTCASTCETHGMHVAYAKVDNPRGVCIYFGGLGLSADRCMQKDNVRCIQRLVRNEYIFMAYDNTGFFESKPLYYVSKESLRQDAYNMASFIASNVPLTTPIIAIGHSFGGFRALQFLEVAHSVGFHTRVCVLINSYYNAWNLPLPNDMYVGCRLLKGMHDNSEFLKRDSKPTSMLIAHAVADELIPFNEMSALARCAEKNCITHETVALLGGHTDYVVSTSFFDQLKRALPL